MLHPFQAVILAAGNGRRMSPRWDLPKPLIPVGGKVLLDHVFAHLIRCGIEEVSIVIGYCADQIRSHPYQHADQMQIDWIFNPDFEQGNGVSLLSVDEKLQSPFLLLMSDHLFEHGLLNTFLKQADPHSNLLATDSHIDRAFDVADATKVFSEGNRLTKIGKNLSHYNQLDTGIFILQRDIFPALRESVRWGNGSLAGGVSMLAETATVLTCDIGGHRWIDVDTPQAVVEAERLMASGLLPF